MHSVSACYIFNLFFFDFFTRTEPSEMTFVGIIIHCKWLCHRLQVQPRGNMVVRYCSTSELAPSWEKKKQWSCLETEIIQVHAGEEDHARPGWTTSIRGQHSPWKSQSAWQKTEINDVHGVDWGWLKNKTEPCCVGKNSKNFAEIHLKNSSYQNNTK